MRTRHTIIEKLSITALCIFLGVIYLSMKCPRVMATGEEIKANTTGQIGVFFGNATCSTGPGVSGLTNATATFGYEKEGGTWGAFIAPVILTEINATEMPGYYKLNYTTNQTDTLGEIRIYGNATGSGAIKCAYKYNIVEAIASDIIAVVDDILDDTAEIQANQSNFVTATGFSTFDHTSDQVILNATQTFDNTGTWTGNVSAVTGAVGSVTGAVGSVTGAVGSISAGGITAASFGNDAITDAAVANDVQVDVVTIETVDATDQLDASSGGTSAQIADAVWDELIAGHTTAASYGLYLSSIYQTIVVRVAQCGDAGGASTIDLDGSASAVNDFYKGQLIAIILGTGISQARTCISYDGATKIATVSPAWATAPDGNSYFAILNTGSTAILDPIGAAAIADAVLDELLADHVIAGSLSAGVTSAASAGDPWSTALPGAYAAGTAGDILDKIRLNTKARGR
jgi:hypothetical protein